ncbi:hypothetical protein C6380_05645 [Pseudomonas syringae pv. actinidiae]|uniref:Uncharacterized protein n=1 Tax=Pseudomonas syringae pv. actinidiae TaxID=103796 RepID=A0AAU8XEU5_PSESF|nr:hypothetical protein CT122_10830 [Pseudomonas syringae pv. actinidiae]AYL80444.1 hypothetical protein CN228_11220 [Pseudomonas syringae pv. actinidiae str. Shaanxi_M228]MBL3832223.1 hypothetical protein [Pseudomonas syringae pv. theae]AYL15098.1 hypothetical protein D9N00_11455 [Pseudomonas syringae pv. actinidiae]MBL3834262.1 hypothetical protein [Pseudomonas syringae pv. theae]
MCMTLSAESGSDNHHGPSPVFRVHQDLCHVQRLSPRVTVCVRYMPLPYNSGITLALPLSRIEEPLE